MSKKADFEQFNFEFLVLFGGALPPNHVSSAIVQSLYIGDCTLALLILLHHCTDQLERFFGFSVQLNN